MRSGTDKQSYTYSAVGKTILAPVRIRVRGRLTRPGPQPTTAEPGYSTKNSNTQTHHPFQSHPACSLSSTTLTMASPTPTPFQVIVHPFPSPTHNSCVYERADPVPAMRLFLSAG